LLGIFEDEASVETDSALATVARHGAVFPPLWRLEAANGFHPQFAASGSTVETRRAASRSSIAAD
jgi:hypothetical protein